jgi:xylan 1,4-beta-xylosidase
VQAQQPVIKVDLSKETGNMDPVWAWFGYDEPNYTYMKDGKKLLSEIAALSPGPNSCVESWACLCPRS